MLLFPCTPPAARVSEEQPHAQDDLRLVEDAGQGAIDVTVGSALDIFGGALAYNDVVTWHMQRSGATSA